MAKNTVDRELQNQANGKRVVRCISVNKMKFYLVTSIVFLTLCKTSALNILGIFPYTGKSHFIVFKVLLKELVNRGHNLTIISYYPETDPPRNYHDIPLKRNEELMEDVVPFRQLDFITLIFDSYHLTTTGRDNCDLMLSNNQVLNLVKEKHKFDVVLMEQFNSDCGLGLAYKLDSPVVAVISSVLMPWHFDRFGMSTNPSFTPFNFLGGGRHPSLFEKIEKVLWDKFFRFNYYFFCQRHNQASLEERFGEIPSLEELGREVKVLLLYQHYSLNGPSLYPTNVIEVGGYHIPKAKPLTGDIKKFVEEAEVGVIYISFGSVVKASSMEPEQLKVILEVIAEFPHRFVWRWDDSSADEKLYNNLPEHLKSIMTNKNKLYTSKWLPQIDLLDHPKTVAFFSHAGMGSTSEALHFGVPILAMPLFGDQPCNAAAIEESGLGIQIDVSDLAKDNLVASFKKILDPTFRENVKRLSKVWHDRPLSAMDTAIYWIEHVARNPNYVYRSPTADLPFYQYYNIDVIGIFLFVIFLIVKASILVCQCCKKPKQIKTPTKNKKQE